MMVTMIYLKGLMIIVRGLEILGSMMIILGLWGVKREKENMLLILVIQR